MELLAPAGSPEALASAVQGGADAVYIGGERFSARKNAQNFSRQEIEDAVRFCHLHGVKLHVAANILVKPDETDDFLEYMGFLNDAGVDAVIVQDIGMAHAVRNMYPDLPLHASTQMTAASISSVKYLEEMGFSRIVLARELSRKQISDICRAATAEIEVFVHGAICMCYSGQCLMSSVIGQRSGNRGMCAQPCRLPYRYFRGGKKLKEGYLLSPKDMSLIDSLGNLEKCGVTSLKIEGRLKRPEYVSEVVSVYRKYFDNPGRVSAEDKEILGNTFSRSGFTDGYFRGNVGAHMMSYQTPGNTAECLIKSNNVPDISRRIYVDIYCKMCKGEKLYIKMNTENGICAECESTEKAEGAINKPITEERLAQQLSKFGKSVFEVRDIRIDMEENLNIAIKEINECRRAATKELEEKILCIPKRERGKPVKLCPAGKKKELVLTAQVHTPEQLRACEEEGIKVIYIPYGLVGKTKNIDCRYAVILPEICDSDEVYEIPEEYGVLISNAGQELMYKNHKKYGGLRLNVFNSYSAQKFDGYESVALSPELNMKELGRIIPKTAAEAVGYGKIPLMIMKNCPVRAIEGKCAKNGGAVLRDRKNEEFDFACDGACHSMLLNSKKIYMADKIKDFEKTAVSRIRLIFCEEDYGETRRIIGEYKKGLAGKSVEKPPENSFTRCHFYRGVQ